MKMTFVTHVNVTKCSNDNSTENIDVEVVEMLLCPGKSRVLFSVGRHR